MTFKNLTGYEIDTLAQSYNLTDGHAFRSWSAAEEAIIDRAGQLFKCYDRRRQVEIESDYVRDFLRLGKQAWDPDALGYLMCFTVSMAFEIVANYLRLNRFTLTLIEPCFDNLADIFNRHQVPLRPFPDALLGAPRKSLRRLSKGLKTILNEETVQNECTSVMIFSAPFLNQLYFIAGHARAGGSHFDGNVGGDRMQPQATEVS